MSALYELVEWEDLGYYVPSCRIVFLTSWLAVLLLLPGCNALNPLCGSARPVPSLKSISPATVVSFHPPLWSLMALLLPPTS